MIADKKMFRYEFGPDEMFVIIKHAGNGYIITVPDYDCETEGPSETTIVVEETGPCCTHDDAWPTKPHRDAFVRLLTVIAETCGHYGNKYDRHNLRISYDVPGRSYEGDDAGVPCGAGDGDE